MLSRREQLLQQPWLQRRYRDHRTKVLRARPAVDSRCPAARPHVVAKPKRRQRERERAAAVVRDNLALLHRLARVMAATTLDNKWTPPQTKYTPPPWKQ